MEKSLDVLESLVNRLFLGNESVAALTADQDVRKALQSAKGVLDPSCVEENFGIVYLKSMVDKHDADLEKLHQQVLDLTRQVSALQRQLQMQGEVSKVAVSIEDRQNAVASECERRVAETGEVLRAEIRKLDAGSRDFARDSVELKRRHTEDQERIADEVSRLKELKRVLQSNNQENPGRLDLVVADPLDGIISQLTRTYGGNVHKKGIVEVSASSCHSNSAVERVVDLGTNSVFCSNNLPNSWLRYDFKGRRVSVVSYSIRSYYYRTGGAHPKSWVVEVSNLGSEGSWTLSDERKDNSDLNAKHVIRNFAVSVHPSGGFRFVRIRTTGKDHSGMDYLQMCAWELFGTISR